MKNKKFITKILLCVISMVMILSATLIPSSAASSGEYVGAYGNHKVYHTGSFVVRHNGDVLTDKYYHVKGHETYIYYNKTTVYPDMDVDELNWLFGNAFQDHIYEAIDKVFSDASLYREGHTWSGTVQKPSRCDEIDADEETGYYFCIAADYTYTFDVETPTYTKVGPMTFRNNRDVVAYICYSQNTTDSGNLFKVAKYQ